VIVSNLEMIGLYAGDPTRVVTLADGALNAAESGARLIRQLLTFARRDMTRPRVLDPNELLAGMDDLLRRTIGPEIEFEIVADPAAGHAYFDASQFEGAIVNLALNARDAVRAAGPVGQVADGVKLGRISISTSRVAGANGSFVAISVADTGCGMSPDVAAQAFDPFFTTKPTGSGPGLGLSQVYGFTTGAGGQVRIDSTVQQGTTVTMLLPLAEPAAV
jgi:signal transduction histidine kinase